MSLSKQSSVIRDCGCAWLCSLRPFSCTYEAS